MTAEGAAPPPVRTVRFGDMSRESRWDAGFHIIRQDLADRLSQIESTVRREDALARLRAIPLKDAEPLRKLSRGISSWSEDARERVIKEYPHLSLAVMEGDADKCIQALLEKRASIDAAIAELRALTTPSKPA